MLQREHEDRTCRLNEQTPDERVKCRLNGYCLKIRVRAPKSMKIEHASNLLEVVK